MLELTTGKIVHRQTLSTGYNEHSAWPLYREPHLLFTGPFRVPAARYELQKQDDALDCKLRWTSRELSNDVVSSVLYQGYVYGFDLKQLQSSKHRASRGVFRCLDWETGKVRWSSEEVGHASVLIADDKLFMLNDTGTLILARASPEMYEELGRVQLFEDDICWTPPTLWRGRLFVRSPTHAVCLYVGKPEDMPRTVTATDNRPLSGTSRLGAAWLLSHEREYPNDAFSQEELTLWFCACVLMLVVAAVASTLLRLLLRRFAGRIPSWSATFWILVFILGFLGPNVFSSWFDRCLFTWPLCVYAAFHGAVLLSCRADRAEATRRDRWIARLAFLGLALIGYGYFELCKAVGMFIGWAFLFGLLPAFPVTWLAGRFQIKRQNHWLVVLCTLTAFSVYFWSCPLLLFWKVS